MRIAIFVVGVMVFSVASAQANQVTGILQGVHEITITTKSQGQIISIRVKEGQHVQKGQVLAIIDDEQETIENDLAKVELETAKQDYEKTKSLKKYVSDEEVMQKKNTFLKKQSEFKLKQYNLKNTQVISPISGLITHRFLKYGETVSSGAQAYEVIQMDELILELDVDAMRVKDLKSGQIVPFTSPLNPGQVFTATVSYVGSVLDKTSGTIRVKLRLKNRITKDGKYELMPGTMVVVRFRG